MVYNFFNPTPPVGRWLNVDSYEQVQQMSVPIDGSPTLFMLKDEPTFYVVTMVNGQKLINGYTFTPLNAPQSPVKDTETEASINPLDARLSTLEQAVNEMKAILKEVKGNEPSRTTATKTKSSQ